MNPRMLHRWLSCGLALLLLAGGAAAQNLKEQENRKARLEKEIAILDGQLRAAAKESESAIGRLSLIRKKVASRRELVEESDRKIAVYTRAINEKQREIDAITRRLDTLTTYYGRLVRGAYKNRNPKIWYMYILASEDVAQGFRRYGYLRDLSKEMNGQARKIAAAKEQLEAEQEQLSDLKKEAEALRSERVAEMAKIQAEEKESKDLVDRLGRDKKKYQQQLNKKRGEVEALNREIERLIRNATAGTAKGTGGKAKPKQKIDYTLDKEFAANKGKLPWPAEGPVVDRFGQHYHPVFTKVKLPFNNGITLALAPQTGVKCVFDGVVKQIVVMPGYNKCILVQHGNYFTLYCKLGEIAVKAGDKVKTGQRLGTVETVQGETQLHFQIWAGREPQNPETWLRP